jgi:hypothetical protein
MALTTQAAAEERFSPSVRITLPISVAYNLEKLTAVLGNIARGTGHNTCFSGVDCTFLNSRDWVVDPETLDINDEPGRVGA